MKIRFAAGFSAIAFVSAVLYAYWAMWPGLRVVGVLLPRRVWLADHTTIWAIGNWIGLVAIFSWMLLLLVLSWSYLPVHRISSMLQSGFIVIAAVLVIAGIVIWMNVLPLVSTWENVSQWVQLVDGIAISLFGAGLFMGGIVTAWISLDLARLRLIPLWWLLFGILAGVAAIPAPFLIPSWMPGAAIVFWVLWCVILATRPAMPNAYTEWT